MNVKRGELSSQKQSNKQTGTSYEEDTGGDVVLTWFKFIYRNQQAL